MSRFSPYTENGGTVLAIAGEDFAVVASDTRQTEGYSIQTRYAPKVFRLNDKAVITLNGMQADCSQFVKRLKQRLEWYRHAHSREIPLQSLARLIQTMLYGKRFFPYYASVILGGIDEEGKGAVYSFDMVGSYEREKCRAAGAASALVQPLLDNQVYFKNQQGDHPAHLPLPHILALVTDSFTGATERHIEVGDGLEMYVVLARGANTGLLAEIADAREVTPPNSQGERIFVVRRELKRD
ncbi:proteasome subunit [Auriculariales sp. MPI-PUGE-AT-0066]|nr:proteasome subunit [Auriculariales sp. MPI-PUGE-AT-0066]